MLNNFTFFAACIAFPSLTGFTPIICEQSKVESRLYEITLIKNSVLSGQASMLLPSSFTPLTQEEIKLKYPGNNRPVEVYGNENGTITVGLSLLNVEVPVYEFEEFAEAIVQQFKKSAPISTWYGHQIKTINGTKMLISEYESPLPDGTSYNLTCYASMHNKVVVYTFNCLQNQKSEWKAIGFRIVESFQTVK
jgi:hypothetical protein